MTLVVFATTPTARTFANAFWMSWAVELTRSYAGQVVWLSRTPAREREELATLGARVSIAWNRAGTPHADPAEQTPEP